MHRRTRMQETEKRGDDAKVMRERAANGSANGNGIVHVDMDVLEERGGEENK